MYNPGDFVTSDMGMPLETATPAGPRVNTTDVFDMDGQASPSDDTPYQLEPGGVLGLLMAGANLATMVMMIEVVVTDQQM